MRDGYLTFGTIRRVVPIHGVCEVTLTGLDKSRLVMASLCRETPSLLYGVHSSNCALPAGSHVLVWVPSESSQGSGLSVILGSIPYNPIPDKSPYDYLNMFDSAAASEIINSAMSSVELVPENTKMEESYTYGSPGDALPGEWTKTTYLNNGIWLSDFILALRGGDRARLEFFPFTDTVRLTAGKLERRSASGDYADFTERGDLPSEIELRSATHTESLGGLGGVDPMAEKDQSDKEPLSYELVNKNPYYNHQRVRGDLAQGELDTYSIPGDDVDKDRPPGVLSEFKGYDGCYELNAMRGLFLTKTNVIPVPWYSRDKPGEPVLPDDLDTIEPEEFKLPESDDGFHGALASELRRDHDLDKNKLLKFKSRPTHWSVPKGKPEVLRDLKRTGVDFSDKLELDKLPSEKPYYDEPEEAKAKITPNVDDYGNRERKVDVFDLSAFLKLNPDGSLVIKGGFGEEIRMHRGNITLTCPGNIISQPGRDFVSLAGVNNIQKAMKGTFEVESQTTTLLSSGNMQLAAGAGGTSGSKEGMLILESKSKAPLPTKVDGDYYKRALAGEASGGGVLIKAEQVAAVSNSVHITNDDPKHLGASEVFVRSASVGVLCSNLGVDMQKAMRLVSPGSMVAMSEARIDVVAPEIGCNTESVRAQGTKINSDFKKEDGSVGKKVMGGSGANLFVEKGILVGTLAAHTVTQDEAGPISGHGKSLGAALSKIMKSDKAPGHDSVDSLGVDPLVKKVEGLAKLGIVLPESRYSAMSLPVSLWQKSLSKGSTALWSRVADELAEDKYAYAYPGKANLKYKGGLKTLSDDGTVKEATLVEGIVVNN